MSTIIDGEDDRAFVHCCRDDAVGRATGSAALAAERGIDPAPRCGIDSVIGDHSGYPITREFLAEIERHWFGIAD